MLHAFTPPATARYTFTLSPAGWDGALYLLDTCPQAAPVTGCLAGSDRFLSSETETVSAPMYQGHTYFVGVDSYTSTSHGRYTLTASQGVALPQGDNCTSPLPLALGTVVTGDTTDANNDVVIDGASSSCPESQGAGNDLLYTFTPPSTGRYTVTLTSTSDMVPVLYVVPTCAKGTVAHCLGGHAPDTGGVPASTTLTMSAGREYTVVVDSATADTGTFTLEVEAAGPGPTGDSCAGTPPVLALDVTAYGDLSMATPSLDPGAASTACTGAAEPGEDEVWAFTPLTSGQYTFAVKAVDLATSPSLYVMSDCLESAPSSAWRGCTPAASAPGRPSRRRWSAAAPTTWWWTRPAWAASTGTSCRR